MRSGGTWVLRGSWVVSHGVHGRPLHQQMFLELQVLVSLSPSEKPWLPSGGQGTSPFTDSATYHG